MVSINTVFDRLGESVERYADRPMLHIPAQACTKYHAGPIEYSYQQMWDAVNELRQRYSQAGYGHGNRVSLLLENRAEFFQHFYALNGLGVCVVPLNAEFVPAEMSYLIDNSEVSLVITLGEHMEKLQHALEAVNRVISVCRCDQLDQLPEAPPVDTTGLRSGSAADAAILYTSGTTGKPKGCVLSNEFFLCVGDWYLGLGGYCSIEPGQDRLITPLPVFHTNALVWSMMAMMQSGGCIIQLDRFHSSTWWETLRESRATIMHYLGVMPAMLMNLPEQENDLNTQIKFGLGGGVEPDLHARFEKRFGFPLIEGWAMTETGSGACFMCERDPRHVGQRCMGRMQPEMEFRIVDDSDRDVDVGNIGELLVRRKGDNRRYGFFTEYYRNPAATSEAWEGDWFHTGDVVKQDGEGSVFFVERKKNIIRRSGENIAAAEVEATLIDHPDVNNCAVIALPDAVREEEVAACVMVNTGTEWGQETAVSMVSYCLERLSYYKVPGYVIFMQQLPVTLNQKIQRGELRKLGRDLMDSEQCIDCRQLKKKK